MFRQLILGHSSLCTKFQNNIFCLHRCYLLYPLIRDILDNNSPYNDIINYSLFDHINYAFYKTIYDLKIKYNVENTITTFGILETCFTPNTGALYASLNNAILHLYCKKGVADSFKMIFTRFSEKQFSYKYFEKHIEKALLPELKNKLFSTYIPNEKSLGLRVHQLIKTDIKKAIWLSSTDGKFNNKINFERSLVKITSRYITELQKLEDMYAPKNISL